jgi:hypothetical protein
MRLGQALYLNSEIGLVIVLFCVIEIYIRKGKDKIMLSELSSMQFNRLARFHLIFMF